MLGKAVAIADGDTFTLESDGERKSIRLEGIDCPEGAQEYGKEATKALARLIFDERVRVRPTGTDRYGRTLAHVYIGDQWINQEMVAKGHAWHYKKYSDDTRLADAESEARQHKMGLWATDNAIPPWEFRNRPQTPVAGSSTVDTPAIAASERAEITQPQRTADGDAGDYWLTTSSGIRHNSRCRHYKNSNGRSCGPNDGKACKICGG